METYLRTREQLLSDACAGTAAARELSCLTDDAVRALSVAAAPLLRCPWAVCASGGWGTGALLPNSDLDLLVLTDAPARDLKPFVEALLYPLWDAGLQVGHQVRSPRAHVAACRRGELETMTASLTARVISGDHAYAQGALARVADSCRRDSRSVLRRLALRARPGSPFLLEPQLKEGAGGKRDYDELIWSAAVVTGRVAAEPGALTDVGLMTAPELDLVRTAIEVLTAARWELQLAGDGEVLSLDAAERVTDPQALQLSLANLWLVVNRVRRRIAADPQEHRLPYTPSRLFGLLDAGASALEELQEAALDGSLESLVPGLRELMPLRRPGLAHTLTVGAHCLASATAIANLSHTSGSLAHSARLVNDLRALQTAALVHDAGKTVPGPGHAERGADAAIAAAHQLGLPEDSAADAGDMVRLHLALAETALHEDLDDEDVILRTAARIGRRELVASLHMLTVADTSSTGPSAWTPWLDALLAQLVARVDAALSPDVDGAGLVTRATRVRDEALRLTGLDSDASRAFLEAAPVRYLASRTAAEALRDAGLVSSLAAVAGAEHVRLAISAGPTDDTALVTVAAWDRQYLLSRLAGAFALAGLDILAFDAHGATGCVALDTFVVRSSTARPLLPEVFTRLERLAIAALRDRYETTTRLAERRRHYPPGSSVPLSIDVHQSGWDTTVKVVAPDRQGLLHDLAFAVSAAELDIRWARARTVNGIAHDTFHVTGPDGGPVDDPGVLGHLSMRLREAL